VARSLKKGPFVDDHLLKKVLGDQESGSRKVIKTWSRRSTILPDVCRSHVCSSQWQEIRSRVRDPRRLIGHKLGEFSPPRTSSAHAGDKEDRRKKGH
jgi:small subunit ribosomal protein S19